MKHLCSNCVHCGEILTDGSWPYYCRIRSRYFPHDDARECEHWHYDGSTEKTSAVETSKTVMRTFSSGATRDTAEGKPDYAGYLCPLVIKRYGEYMLKHQKQADGKMRDSDNWKKGMDNKVYLSSLFRHFHDVWMELEGYKSREGLQDALCAMLFNVQGILRNELLKQNVENDHQTHMKELLDYLDTLGKQKGIL